MIGDMTRRVTSAEFIGRAAELSAIRGALDETRSGSPVHVLVAGEAGVGKSRLLGEIAAEAASGGWTVLRGGAIDLGEGSLPFGPWVELLRGWMRGVGRPAAVATAGPVAADLGGLVPELEPGQSRLVADRGLQGRIPEALLELLARLSERAPVLVQLDDLHWADAGSLSATAYLLRALDAQPVSILATYRSDELHRRHPLRHWLSEVARSSRILRLVVPPFEVDEIAALVSGVLGREATYPLVEELHRRSDGNAFFAEELLASGADESDLPLSSTLRDLLAERIARVSDPARSLLGVMAAAGREVDHELLATIVADEIHDPREALREVVDAGLLVPVVDQSADRYAFRHCLLQEATYDDLLPGERRRLHRDIALALEARNETGTDASRAAEVAYHWREARELARAFQASVRAGDASTAAYAFSQARDEYEHALALWSQVPDAPALAGMDRIELLRRTGRAAYILNDDRRALALHREAVELSEAEPDRVRTSVLLEAYGRVLFISGSTSASIDAYRQAVEMIRAEPRAPERARVLSGLAQAYMLEGNYRQSTELCREAIELARELGVRSAEGHALNTMGVNLAAVGDCGAGVESLEQALAIAIELRIPDDIGRAFVNLADALWLCGDAAGALRRTQDALAHANELGIAPSYGFFLRSGAVWFSYLTGDWETAGTMYREGRSRAPEGEGSELYWLCYTLPFVVGRGWVEADELWVRARKLMERYERAYTAGPPVEIGGAELAIWQGRPQEALELAERAVAGLSDTDAIQIVLHVARLGARAAADLAISAVDTDARDAALRRLDALRAAAHRMVARADGPASAARTTFQTELATIEAERTRVTGDELIDRWQDALDRCRADSSRYLAAYAAGQLAIAAADTGDRVRATGALRDAHATAERLGATPLLEWLDRIGRRLRIALGAATTTDAARDQGFGLTARELEVLALVAAGRTNRQIADELFISQNTAGVHVSNILGKLGVASRTEAATIAVQMKLV
jgi:DNA-binding CsgD family transcriptional regulator/tetratricopeptide (TPR) repeat protein